MLGSLFRPEIWMPTIPAVIPAVFAIQQHFLGGLEKYPSNRHKTANILESHAWLEFYKDRLKRGLDWLDHWMGRLNTWSGEFQSFNVCLAVSAAYTTLSFIAGWTLHGPGSIG